jgi:3-methylfumaryl-CoA hydratase
MSGKGDTMLSIDELRRWIGRTDTSDDTVTLTPARALAATLDRGMTFERGDALPPPWHWLYFLPISPLSEAGPDGHPKRGGFLPPVPLPRRMWAGSRMEFFRPLRVGESIRRVSRIADVSLKEGRTGSLVFVKVRHDITAASESLLTDEHDIVYRDLPREDEAAPPPKDAPTDHAWQREIRPDPVLLFRFSALTFNSHRIHYDHPYVTQVEGYPGLIVHGPLLATLLLDLLLRERPRVTVMRFEFRAVKPVFDTTPFFVCGRPAQDGANVALWAKDAEGRLCMDASATIARDA